MVLWMYKLSGLLAQVPQPWDDIPERPEPAAPKRPMSFQDLQQGLRAYNNGETNSNYFRYSLIGMVAVVVLLAIFLHFRQRRKEGGVPDSPGRLAWELSRKISFPLGARFALVCVARYTKVPMATLLISATAFDRA